MKMARELICDVCKKRTEEIAAKLFYTPTHNGQNKNAFHSRYTHHLDVGVCCAKKLLDVMSWTPRKSAAEYHASRRKVKSA